MIDKTTLNSAQSLIDSYVVGLQTLTGLDRAEQAQAKARELESNLAALGIFSPDDLKAARKNIERQDYHDRLLKGVWETSNNLKLIDQGTLTRDKSLSTRNELLDMEDTITYHYYSHPNYVLYAADTKEAHDIGDRAISKGVEISQYDPRLKSCLLRPPTKHVFRMISSGFSNTITLRDSFLSLLTITLHSLGVELEIYPDRNNLKVGDVKVGLAETRVITSTGIECPKLWENIDIQTKAVIALSINEEFDSELAKYVFGDENLKITGLKQLIGGVSPETMFSALSAVRR